MPLTIEAAERPTVLHHVTGVLLCGWHATKTPTAIGMSCSGVNLHYYYHVIAMRKLRVA